MFHLQVQTVDIIEKLLVPLHIIPHVQVHDMYVQKVLYVSRHSVIDVEVQVCKIMMFALHLVTCSHHMYHQRPVALKVVEHC